MSGKPPHASSAPRSLKARWIGLRNRVLTDVGFQRWASAFPPFSLVARRRAADLFDLVAGFSYSQVLLCAVESGLLSVLAGGPEGLPEIATATGLSEAAALRLLRAAAALELAEEAAPGQWMLGRQGAVLHANPGIQAMIRHHRLLYADLADPLALLRADRGKDTALSRFWRYARDSRDAAAYSELMALSQQMVADQVLQAYRFARHRAVLDVGGGHGIFAARLCAACPGLRIGVFDLPAVQGSANHAPGITAHAGDFFADPLPEGYDCISLIRILHDHDDRPALALLRAIHAALPPGGTLVLAEPMARTQGAQAMGDAYFGFYLWAMNSGRPRTIAEIGEMLETAGFRSWRRLATRQPIVTSAIVAQV